MKIVNQQSPKDVMPPFVCTWDGRVGTVNDFPLTITTVQSNLSTLRYKMCIWKFRSLPWTCINIQDAKQKANIHSLHALYMGKSNN